MTIDFFEATCQTNSNRKLFGLCDDPPPAENPAYIDEFDGAKWIAVVENEYKYDVTFTGIDHCIPIKKSDGTKARRCDGVLTYNSSVIFVELKGSNVGGNDWIKEGDEQLRITIGYFEKEEISEEFNSKQAYIANCDRPKFRASQMNRMNQFFEDTGYVLRIENRIRLQ